LTEDEKFKSVMDALERVLDLFKVERALFLTLAAASGGFFVWVGYHLFSGKEIHPTDIVLLLGASGVSTACSTRTTFFMNRAFNILEALLRPSQRRRH
jgi:hypothetical protein